MQVQISAAGFSLLGGTLAALVKTLDKVKDLKATKVAEYGKACSVPDSCTSKAKKLAYLLGESLDRLR